MATTEQHIPIPQNAADAAAYLRSRGLGKDESAQELTARLLAMGGEGEGRVPTRVAAERMGIAYRTLRMACRRRGLPKPSNVLALGRIISTLHALQQNPGDSIWTAAISTGWSEPFTFSNAVMGATGYRPSEFTWPRERPITDALDGWLVRQGVAR